MFSKGMLGLCTLTLLLIIVGCTQNAVSEIEQLTTVKNETFTVQDGRVVFKDYNSYVSFVQKTQTSITITAIQQLINAESYVDPFESIFKRKASKAQISSAEAFNADNELPSNSEVLLSLLNEKAILQVGDLAIRYTKYYDFSAKIEHIDKLEDDAYLAKQIEERSKVEKPVIATIKSSHDVIIHPVFYSVSGEDCIDDPTVIGENPCEGPGGGPLPNPVGNIIVDKSLTPINSGQYVRYVDDRKAYLHVHFRTSNARLEIRPSIDPHRKRIRILGVFDWINSPADIMYADVYDVVLTKYNNNYWSGPSVLYTPNVPYPDFNGFETSATTFGTQDSDNHYRAWLHFPLDLTLSYRIESIKSINYIQNERGGKIYKVTRIAENTSNATFRFL